MKNNIFFNNHKLKSVLEELNETGVKTLEEVKAHKSYNNLFYALMSFIGVLFNSKSLYNKNGECTKVGNKDRVAVLTEVYCLYNKDDLVMDAVIHTLNKIHLVLNRPVLAQMAYIQVTSTRFLIELLRKNRLCESLDKRIHSSEASADEDDFSLLDRIEDPNGNTEDWVFARAAVRKKKEDNREFIFNSVHNFKDEIVMLFIILACSFMKPREIAALIKSNTFHQAFSYVVDQVSQRNGLNAEEIKAELSDLNTNISHKDVMEALNLSASQNSESIARFISKVKYKHKGLFPKSNSSNKAKKK